MSESSAASGTGMWLADHFSLINRAVPPFLNAVNLAHKVVGPKPLEIVSQWLNKATGHFVPVWNPYMPKGASKLLPATAGAAPAPAAAQVRLWKASPPAAPAPRSFGPAAAIGAPRASCLRGDFMKPSAATVRTTASQSLLKPLPTLPPTRIRTPQAARAIPRRVVYMPACVTRMMGPAAGDSETASVHEKLMSLFSKVGGGPLCAGARLVSVLSLVSTSEDRLLRLEILLLLSSAAPCPGVSRSVNSPGMWLNPPLATPPGPPTHTHPHNQPTNQRPTPSHNPPPPGRVRGDLPQGPRVPVLRHDVQQQGPQGRGGQEGGGEPSVRARARSFSLRAGGVLRSRGPAAARPCLGKQ